MDFFSRKNRKRFDKFHAIIDGLSVSDRGQFFNLLYHAMIEHPVYVILSDMPVERKYELLNQMMRYYESHEDYEKCAKLLKIQKEVK